MSYREQGKLALGTVLKQEQNIRTIEKYIFNLCEGEGDLEQEYNRNLYQVVGDVLNEEKLKKILTAIKEGQMGWKHPSFKTMQIRMEEQDDFVLNPFEVEEGVLECKARLKDGNVCGSKRVFSYSKQVRSSDEPMSTFATCCACGTKWSYSG